MGSKPDPVRDEWVQSQYEKLGHVFEMVRKASGFSQQKAADGAGLVRGTVAGLENAVGNPELETILSVAYALDMPIGDLLEEEVLPRLLRDARARRSSL
jgi:transcriptional regulator with XRE-family HTH domain